MVKTIGNPLSWGGQSLSTFATIFRAAVGGLRQSDEETISDLPEIRTLTLADLRYVIRMGFHDFATFRTDVLFIVLLYPVIGMCLVWFAADVERLPLIFPLISGFALLGPLASVGLYELSRRHEQGLSAKWRDALKLLTSPVLAPILALGVYLFAIFIIWLSIANGIYTFTLGPEPPVSLQAFINDILHTGPGRAMIVIGVSVGLFFAVLVLATSLVSFPMLLDREVGLPVAVVTSVLVVRKNPLVTAVWGLIVAGSLAVGSLPFFVGLIVVMPVLGHATWHLYRKAVAAPGE